MTQRARRTRHGDGVGTGLRALLLPATAATTSPSTAIASCCSARWQQEYQQEQSGHGSWQSQARAALSPTHSGC
jgi:hypothetical protein